jgi:hypothetical protein
MVIERRKDYIRAKKMCMFPGQKGHPMSCPVFNECIANKVTEADKSTIQDVLCYFDKKSLPLSIIEKLGALVNKYRTKGACKK